ncbi:MAG: hypothetical protein WA919_07365 [Coleofasciculaceae cyanobacterium]
MSKLQRKTKNDIAWEDLFEQYKILDEVSLNETFEIDSSQINEVRESRLMAKFDHSVNLPLIFRNNRLSILPISRSRYVIGKFETYCRVDYNSNIEEISTEFPDSLESIDYTNLYSESSALNCAFNAGIIDDLIGETSFHTLSGRMSTGTFSFSIRNIIGKESEINVINSQCEIDAGFESKNYLVLIEAKNYTVDDFLIRQLYYPYRLWKDKVTKIVVPVLMTYSNDKFSFFVYKFENDLDYNSLSLIKQKDYIIDSEEINLSDVNNIFDTVNIVNAPYNVPFPQADKLERVVDLLSLLVEKNLTKDEITENYQFDVRQTSYYTDAGRYLRLIDKYRNCLTKEITFSLTKEGNALLKKRPKLKYLELIRKILEHEVFYKVFELAALEGEIPDKSKIRQVMSESDLNLSETTIERRSTTVLRWIEWIWLQID